MFNLLPISRTNKKQNLVRLSLESLEDRTTPAAFVVTNLDNDGEGSLRAAVASANKSGDKTNQITFSKDLAEETINLSSEISINSNLTITGPDPLFEVSGKRGKLEPPEEAGWRVFNIAQGKVVAIVSMVVSEGGALTATDPNGGLIKVNSSATLILRNSWLRGGLAKGDGGGVWVDSGGKIEMHGSWVNGNKAIGNGGGIAVNNGAGLIFRDMVIEAGTPARKSDILQNEAKNGGGVWFLGTGNTGNCVVQIQDTIIGSNIADGSGGGLYLNWQNSTNGNLPVKIERTSIHGNFSRGPTAGLYLAAPAKFGGSVKVTGNRSNSQKDIGFYISGNHKVEGKQGIEESENEFEESMPGGDNSLPSSTHIGEGAEAVLSGQVLFGGGIAALRNSGIIVPSGFGDDGGDIGTITIAGKYIQEHTASYKVDIASADNDKLVVTGAANEVSLAGALEVSLVAGFAASPGTVYTIIANHTSTLVSGYCTCLATHLQTGAAEPAASR